MRREDQRLDVLVLHAMLWPVEIRDPAELLPPPVELSGEEIEGALVLMETMARDDLEGEEFLDTYTEALEQVIEAKREEKPLPEAPEPKQPPKVLDLMAALQGSVQKAGASRGETTPRCTSCPRRRGPRRRRRRSSRPRRRRRRSRRGAGRAVAEGRGRRSDQYSSSGRSGPPTLWRYRSTWA